MSVSNSGAGGGGPFFLHIEGLPRRYTWQTLKDLIRHQATHGVWTEMAVYPHGRTAGTGHARIQRKDEADRLYHYLTSNYIESKLLRVHLWDISRSPPRFKTCNCGRDPQNHPNATRESAWIAQMVMAPDWQRFTLTSPMDGPPLGYTMSSPNNYVSAQIAAPVQPPRIVPQLSIEQQQQQMIIAMASIGLDARDPSERARFLQFQDQQAQMAQTVPAYAGNAAGLPVNVRNGTVQTEARGVFVSGLNYKATEKDIRAYFSRAGNVTQVKLSKDEATKKSKGNCTVQYTTAAEASEAVHLFNRQKFMGMQLNLRADRSTVPVDTPLKGAASQQPRPSGMLGGPAVSGPRGPTIVNGSQVR
ncbi:Putative RNA recognition motif domain, nucleotide-binding alpha-beta plait domain superfamily [Septoria linicola]|uniref:RNA recognition motif domain, nucleotide-binding alpha-beta plait domain superfamily n=1 Tax=Septoria linicola TaxID=215465 RepID=A0A9Q9EQK9_9PEZI|nr:putative RNA recognition motif domain, nucleotide-binding alpha-beta plait domain superfamily [Septoria linicola]USW59235.1 Putative RNA recognition motif domain, nucleotide-binding alpha-beta plait domain superfamily [Septoria linicola]